MGKKDKKKKKQKKEGDNVEEETKEEIDEGVGPNEDGVKSDKT